MVTNSRRPSEQRRNSTPSCCGIGGLFIHALLEAGNVEGFQAVSTEMFTDDELEVYQLVRDHLEAHEVLPSAATMRNDYGVRMQDEIPEPASYYLNRMRKRAIFNAILNEHGALVRAVEHRDMDAAVEAVNRMQEGVQTVRSQQITATDLETVSRTVERMEGYSLAQIRDLNLEPNADVVHGMVGPGLTLLAGDPKVGKSWLVMDLSISVAQGRSSN